MASKAQVKKKICWNCEGSVPRDALNCPFCAVYLNREEEGDLSPPFRMDVNENEEEVESFDSEEEIKEEKPRWGSLSFSGWRGIVFSLILLMAGVFFLLFGFILTVFSENGFLTLQWNAHYWWVYFVLALPLLATGYLILRQTED